MSQPITIVVPAFNEETAVGAVLKDIRTTLDQTALSYEIIVVDDGSMDKTSEVALAGGARVLRNPENAGYGASIKRGILSAKYRHVVIIDADGTYDVESIPALAADLDEYDMVVGARQGAAYRSSLAKLAARRLFRFLVEYASGRSIPDINSGLRAFRKEAVLPFFHFASNSFSFTTTITLALTLNGYFVKYVPVKYFNRVGKSKINHFRDTLRALQIIVQAILYYNPLKLFLLPCGLLLGVAGSLLVPALVTRDRILLLAAVVAGVGSVTVGGIGLIADILRRDRNPN